MSSQDAAPLPGAMPGGLPEGARPPPDFDPTLGAAAPRRGQARRPPPRPPPPADFEPIGRAKALLRARRAGTPGTLDRNTGHPFASLVNVATDAHGSPVILTSRLSTHTANLEHDRRASILLAETGKGDPPAHPRLTGLGPFAGV